MGVVRTEQEKEKNVKFKRTKFIASTIQKTTKDTKRKEHLPSVTTCVPGRKEGRGGLAHSRPSHPTLATQCWERAAT